VPGGLAASPAHAPPAPPPSCGWLGPAYSRQHQGQGWTSSAWQPEQQRFACALRASAYTQQDREWRLTEFAKDSMAISLCLPACRKCQMCTQATEQATQCSLAPSGAHLSPWGTSLRQDLHGA
jgi:hypothetical protein